MDREDIRQLVGKQNPKDIWTDIEPIIESGVDINYILTLGEPSPQFFVDFYEKILDEFGANPLQLFRLNEEWYRYNSKWTAELASAMATYVKYGLDVDFAKEWLLQNIELYDIIPNAKALEVFNINARDYISEYLGEHQDYAVQHIGSLPEPLTPNDVVKHLPISEISWSCSDSCGYRYSGFNNFVEKFVKAGGDINLLARKFVKEVGYQEDEDDLVTLALMINFGATKIDANRIIDALTFKAFIYKDEDSIQGVKLWFHEMLSDHADAAHLEKLAN